MLVYSLHEILKWWCFFHCQNYFNACVLAILAGYTMHVIVHSLQWHYQWHPLHVKWNFSSNFVIFVFFSITSNFAMVVFSP